MTETIPTPSIFVEVPETWVILELVSLYIKTCPLSWNMRALAPPPTCMITSRNLLDNDLVGSPMSHSCRQKLGHSDNGSFVFFSFGVNGVEANVSLIMNIFE